MYHRVHHYSREVPSLRQSRTLCSYIYIYTHFRAEKEWEAVSTSKYVDVEPGRKMPKPVGLE